MVGNVLQWCADWYDGYTLSPDRNPRGPETGTCRALRGGSWWLNNLSRLRCGFRNCYTPGDRSVDVGFRCAQDLR